LTAAGDARDASVSAEVRVDVRPRWPFRPPRPGADGILRRHGGALRRLVFVDDAPVDVAVLPLGADRVRFAARGPDAAAAHAAIARMRFAFGVDDDLAPFHRRFRDDPLLGGALRAAPALRVGRRPDAWEALLAAVCEQLIDGDRALAIQRALIDRLGGARRVPSAAVVAAAAPAELEACGLTAGRAAALRRAAVEVVTGRVDLQRDQAFPRLRAIPGIGRWTLDMLAVHGQGRFDQVAAGDLNYLKAVGRLRQGRPGARATEAEVRELLEPYRPWQALAGAYLLSFARRAPGRVPRPAGTRSSAPGRRSAAA
jgi:DNA-3-methyladenine glycosylase II